MKAKRKYNNQNSTVLRALEWDQRAIERLHRKWPRGCRIMPAGKAPYYEPWPKFLAAVLINVLSECGPCDPLLPASTTTAEALS